MFSFFSIYFSSRNPKKAAEIMSNIKSNTSFSFSFMHATCKKSAANPKLTVWPDTSTFHFFSGAASLGKGGNEKLKPQQLDP